MMRSKKAILLIGTSLAACLTAALMGLAIMTGPAVSSQMRTTAGPWSGCRAAVRPLLAARCMNGHTGKS